MASKLKTAATSAGVALIAGFAGFLGGSQTQIRVVDNTQVVHEIQSQDYETIKTDILAKIEKGETLTWDEYRWFVFLMDYEIQKRDGISMEIRGDEDLLQKTIYEITK